MSTVLVIEDTQDNYDLIEDALEDAHNIVHAVTGQQGLDQVKAAKPDIILLDMALPGLDGWEVTRMLRANPESADIPVVALTAHAMAGDRQKCLEAGCDEYLAKPVNIKELRSMIDRFLDRQNANSAG